MLSTINGIDLFLLFTVIGAVYYASIQSDNADIAKDSLVTAKQEIACLFNEGSEMSQRLEAEYGFYNSLSDQYYALLAEHDKAKAYLDYTGQWRSFNQFVSDQDTVFDYNADPWVTPPQTSEKPSQADLDEWANLI